MKKILALFLTLILIAGVIPFGAVSAEGEDDIFNYIGLTRWKNNKAWLITKCNKELAGDVVIPSMYSGLPITGIKGGAFSDCELITSITMPDTVTEIYYGTPFSNCDALETIRISSSLVSIDGVIASTCISLREIIVDENNQYFSSVDGVLFNKDKTELLFYPGNKSNLTYTVPNTVKVIGNASFKDAHVLTELIIPDNVETISSGIFQNSMVIIKNVLQKVSIGKGVKFIGKDAFSDCKQLTYINISDVASFSEIEFENAYASPLADKSTSTVGSKDLYLNGELLVNLVIPDGVEKISDYAFKNCRSIETLHIPDSVTSIGTQAFSKCSSLKSVRLSENITDLNSTFEFCGKLEEIVIPEGVTTISGAFANCGSLKKVTIPSTVTSISNNAFYFCYGLQDVYTPSLESWCKIVFKDNVHSVPSSQLGTNLYINNVLAENIIIPDTITKINSYAFRQYTSIKTVEIPESVTEIGSSAFLNCSSISSVEMHDGISKIGNSAFSGCKSLTSIEIPKGITTIENNTFTSCESIKEIVIPENITSIGQSAFSNCKNLVKITIPSTVTSIGKSAFYSCQKTKEVYIDDINVWLNYDFSNSGTSPLDHGSGKLYVNNELLTELELPDSMTKIAANQLKGINSLTKLFIPKTVTAIDDYGLGLYYMKDIYYEGTAEEWSVIEIKTSNDYYINRANIHFNCKGIPTELKVTTLPEKVEYIKDIEELDLTGGIFTVYYKNGKSEEIDLANAEISGFDNTVLGEQNITVKYYGLTTEFTVKIIPKPTTLIAITKLPQKLKYDATEIIDLTGGEIVVCYVDGTYETIPMTMDMLRLPNSLIGFTTVTVEFNYKQVQFPIFIHRHTDIDHNGQTTATDVALLKKSILKQTNQDETHDLNVDGNVNVLDLVYMKKVVSK